MIEKIYDFVWELYSNNRISELEWKEFCMIIFEGLLEKNVNILKHLKEWDKKEN